MHTALTVHLGGWFGVGGLGGGGAGHGQPAHELAEATVIVLQREVQHVANGRAVVERAKPFRHGSTGGLHGGCGGNLEEEEESSRG